MKLKIRYLIIKYWLLIFFILLFVFIAVYQVSLENIWQNISSLTLWQLIAILCVYFLFSLLTILVRKYLLYALHSRSSFKNLLYIHFSTMAAHYSTPAKIGYPLTVYLLKKFDNVPYTCGTALIAIELTINMVISGLLALAGSFFFLTGYFPYIGLSFLILTLVLLVTILVFLLLKKKNQNSNIKKLLLNITNSFSAISPWGIIIYSILATLLQILATTNLILLSFFLSDGISIFQAVAASSTAFFLGALSMIPLGIGVRETTMLLMLNQFGIDNVTGISIVAIQRLLSTGLTFVLGVIFGSILGIKNLFSEKNSFKINNT